MNNLDLFTNKKFLEYEEKGGSILLSLHKLFRKACSHGRISSTEFKEAFVTFDSFSDFDNDLQHDAHEFMTLIMDKISEVLRDNNDESDTVSQWFRRAEVSEVLCPTCGMKNVNNNDTSTILQIAIRHDSFVDCLEEHYKVEEVHDYFCAYCRKFGSAEKNSIS